MANRSYGDPYRAHRREQDQGFLPCEPERPRRGSAPADPYRDRDRYRRGAPEPKPKPKRPGRRIATFLASIAVLAALVGGGFLYVQSLPAHITLNGASIQVSGQKTLADALRASGIKPKPGDLVAIDGSVLEAGAGEPFRATINAAATTDLSAKLISGDVVELGDGQPTEEPSSVVETPMPFAFETQGNGAIHLVEGQGADGLKRTKTGSVSGIVVEEMVQEPVNIVRRNVTPDVGGDMVVALTFDDGPWKDTTAQILDVLAQHGAKATFFTVGDRIAGEGADLVRRAAAEGHQVCTHSFDHAAGSGQSVNLGYMSPDEQVAEVQNGYAAIEAATGAEASRVFRAPGGNYDDEVMRAIGGLVSAEIGWNIDSQDWQKPGAGAIASQIKDAWPGAIILLHDGGGDRSQTVEALKEALPYLKAQGYRFVTIDELMAYPLS